MPTLYFVLWLMTTMDGSVQWNRFDFYFDTQEQCLAAARLMPDVQGASCVTDREDAILRETQK